MHDACTLELLLYAYQVATSIISHVYNWCTTGVSIKLVKVSVLVEVAEFFFLLLKHIVIRQLLMEEQWQSDDIKEF